MPRSWEAHAAALKCQVSWRALPRAVCCAPLPQTLTDTLNRDTSRAGCSLPRKCPRSCLRSRPLAERRRSRRAKRRLRGARGAARGTSGGLSWPESSPKASEMRRNPSGGLVLEARVRSTSWTFKGRSCCKKCRAAPPEQPPEHETPRHGPLVAVAPLETVMLTLS